LRPPSRLNGFGLTALLTGVALSNSFAMRIGRWTVFVPGALCRASG
jgi:hypothetical protein